MTHSPQDRSGRIAAAFGRASGYDAAAAIQRDAAEQLAGRIGHTGLPADPRILEIGCGTGLLTRALSDAIGPARWTVSDIAPAMVERARQSVRLAADYRVIDGEVVDPALGRFDLIASSMAFQWFADLPAALVRLGKLLEPAGILAFSTMAAGSFAEWNAALAAEGLPSGTPDYPSRDALLAMTPAGMRAEIALVEVAEQQSGARSFLRRLKQIGAGTPTPGHRPAPPSALRQAMTRFDAGPRIVTYRIGYCLLERIRG